MHTTSKHLIPVAEARPIHALTFTCTAPLSSSLPSHLSPSEQVFPPPATGPYLGPISAGPGPAFV